MGSLLRSNASILQGFVSGKLRPATTVISDSLVQPGLLLLRELIDAALARQENVCLVCCEIDSHRFIESLRYDEEGQDLGGLLHVLDCNLDSDTGFDRTSNVNVKSFDIEDMAGLSRSLFETVTSDTEHTTIYFDSLNALLTFNSSPEVLRTLRKAPAPIVLLHHTDLPTSPIPENDTSTLALLPSLLSANGRNNSIHFTLHPPALLAHLHYIYSIEDVGQSHQSTNKSKSKADQPQHQHQPQSVDARVYQYLQVLHKRGWGSPLSKAESEVERWNGYEDTEDFSKSGSNFDSPDSSRLRLDLLGMGANNKGTNNSTSAGGRSGSSSSKSNDGTGGRSVLEYALRGLNQSNKRSDASKVLRGLEGLVCYSEERRLPDDARSTLKARHNKSKRILRISSVPVHEVLRIKPRSVNLSSGQQPLKANPEDPTSYAMFNLSLTDRQREAREGVALPFTPKDGFNDNSASTREVGIERQGGSIIYEPDSADDVDESDPDEDLDL